MAEDLGRSLEQLTATIKEQNEELQQLDTLSLVDSSIVSLEKSESENAAQLRETFREVKEILETSSDPEQIEIAREQLETLKEASGTEEENRETAKRQEEANALLSKMVSGIDGLADSYDQMLDNLAPSGGLLAGLGAAALLFMDPQTLFAGVQSAIDGIFAIVDSIKMFLEGDFTKGFELLGDNIGAVGAIVGTIAVLFGGRIIRLFSGLVKGVQGVIRGVSGLAARFSGLTKIFGRLFLPFTIITGAIGAIQGAIDGFKEDGVLGGIEGAISGLLTTIVGYPLDLLTSAVAWIAGKLGFENAQATLEAFSFSDLIDNAIGGIFDMVKGAFNWIGTLFTNPVAALDKLAMALIGPDGILGVITAPIDKAINWVMGLFGIKDPTSDFSLYDTLYTPIDKAITWIQGLFTDPVAALQQAWNGLVGEGGLVDILLSPVDKAIAWVQGLFKWGDPTEPFKITTLVKDAFKAAKDWVVGLFTWSSEAGTGEDGSWSLATFIPNAFADVKKWMLDKFEFATGLATEGWTNLSTYMLERFTKAKDWVLGKFTFAKDLATEGWTNLSTYMLERFTKAKDWVLGKFTFATGLATEGWTNLSTYMLERFTDVKKWMLGKFEFATGLATKGWTNLTDFVSTKWTEVKTWFTGLFDWASDGLADKWTNLTDFVKGKWTEVKTWFTGLLDWSAPEGEENFLIDLFNETIEKVKTFFTDLFDFLPSIEEIKASLQEMLPSWLQPDSVSDMASELESQGGVTREEVLAATTDEARAALAKRADDNSWTYGYNEAMRAIEAIQAAELNSGGIVKAPETGGLAVLHGAEIVAPLNSPQGQVLMAINDLMNAKAASGAGEYGGMGGPIIVQGGSNSSSNNTNNVSTSSYTIQQGITPDDFLKRDFINFSY